MYDEKEVSWFDLEKYNKDYKIVIFGAGKRGQKSFFQHKEYIDFCGVIDNNPQKNNMLLYDIWENNGCIKNNSLKVHNLAWLKEKCNPDNTVIIVATKYEDEIFPLLAQLNYSKCFSSAMLDKATLNCLKYNPNYIPVQNDSIFFFMDYYGGHGKYITIQILEKMPNIKVIWGVKQRWLNAPKGVQTVYIDYPLEFCKEYRAAKIVVMDSAISSSCISKPKGQVWIQVKHWSSITLKKFYLEDCILAQNDIFVADVKYTMDNTNYFFVGSKFDEDTCRNGFNYNGEYKYIGSPRSDGAFCKESYSKVRAYYHLKDTDKIILYAPTFRHKAGTAYGVKEQCINIDFGAVCNALKNKYNEKFVFLMRLHPAVDNYVSEYVMDDYVVDASSYDDVEELVAAADILISDYSSVMFEAAYIKRPIFLYAPDLDDYLENERQLLIDYNELPFPVSKNNVELINDMMVFSREKYEKIVGDFLDSYGVKEDGHASERAAEFILDLIGAKRCLEDG